MASLVRRQSQYSQAMVRDVSIRLEDAALAALRPGMSAKVDIEIDRMRTQLAVPEGAIRYRDGKACYLNDLPLVLKYVLEVCSRYRDLQPFQELLLRLARAS